MSPRSHYVPLVIFLSLVMFVTFVLFGHWVEVRSRQGSSEALRALLDLTPLMAMVLRNGQPVSFPQEGRVGKIGGRVRQWSRTCRLHLATGHPGHALWCLLVATPSLGIIRG